MISKEQIEEIKEKIRQILVRMPRVSCRELAKQLNIDKDSANKFKNEILKENADRINKQVLEEEMGKIESEFEETSLELWRIISSDDASHKEKINAIKSLVDSKKKLFDIKFDAGIFSRKLGELDLKEENKLDKLLNNVNDKTKRQFAGILKEVYKRNKETQNK